MRPSLVLSLSCALTFAVAGCGGSIRNGNAALADAALVGTWDLTATPTTGGGTTSGTLVLRPSSLELTIGGRVLKLEGAGSSLSLTSTGSGVVAPGGAILVTRTPGALDTGALPLDVGGAWLASSEDGAQQCHARLAADAFSGECSAIDTGDWGLALHGTVQGTRLRPLASSFGDLGGEWRITQGDVACAATFEGVDFTMSCTRRGRLTGSFSAHVTDSVASGTSSNGSELAARRRQLGE